MVLQFPRERNKEAAVPTGPIIFDGFEFFSSLAHKKLFSCPFTLRVRTELNQLLWEWLEDGLILNVILAETNCPALQHCQKGAGGDLLIFVPIDAAEEMVFFLTRELVLEIFQGMHKHISLGRGPWADSLKPLLDAPYKGRPVLRNPCPHDSRRYPPESCIPWGYGPQARIY